MSWRASGHLMLRLASAIETKSSEGTTTGGFVHCFFHRALRRTSSWTSGDASSTPAR